MRTDFWREKLQGNALRDERVAKELSGIGWTPLTIWECEIGEAGLLRLEAAIKAEPPND